MMLSIMAILTAAKLFYRFQEDELDNGSTDQV
jgi:hypothetical protein